MFLALLPVPFLDRLELAELIDAEAATTQAKLSCHKVIYVKEYSNHLFRLFADG